MKSLLTIVLAITILVPSFVFAQVATSTLPDPGTLPDSAFYFLKEWREGIQLFFTFGAEKKAEQYLHLAEVRLAEYERMIEKGKEDIAERTLEKYEHQLGRALTKAEELKAKGEGMADELKTKTEEAAAKHLTVLERNLTKVSGSAKEGIERALESSRKQLEKLDDLFDEEFEDLLDDDEDEDVSAVPADWKTYRNEQYGFEFKYPPFWVTQSTGGFVLVNIFNRDPQSFPEVATRPGYIKIQTQLGNKPPNEPFRDFVQRESNSIKSGLGGDTSKAEISELKLHTRSFLFSPVGFGSGYYWYELSPTAVISTVIFVHPESNDLKETALQILSTFKFISSGGDRGAGDIKDFGNLIDDKGLENELDNLLEGLE